MDCSPQGCKEVDMTERLTHTLAKSSKLLPRGIKNKDKFVPVHFLYI